MSTNAVRMAGSSSTACELEETVLQAKRFLGAHDR
jgi:hypothetical protein